MANFPLNNRIVLERDDDAGEAFSLHAGYWDITAGVRGSATFPDTITLQRRFKDETGAYVDWQDDFELSGTDRTAVFQASPEIEFRVTASAVGASVKVSPIKIATN